MATTRQQLYAVIGEVAITFSNLHHNVRRIAFLLMDRTDTKALRELDDWSTYQVLRRIKTDAPIRLPNHEALRDEVIALVDEVDQLRPERNLFVHGQWITDNRLVRPGQVLCWDYKLEYDPLTKAWRQVKQRQFTLDQLRSKATQIAALRDQAIGLSNRIQVTLLATETE